MRFKPDSVPEELLTRILDAAIRGPSAGSVQAKYQELRLNRLSGASIYPAIQNIILACPALGLGTLITTNHTLLEDEVRTVLALPPEMRTYALMPIGYPRDKFGPVSRRPLREVACADRYGHAWLADNFQRLYRSI